MHWQPARRARAYLVAKELKVGDIVLAGSPKLPLAQNWAGQLIRPLTLSLFTHASLMVTRLGMLETNGPGQTSQISVGPFVDLNGRLLVDLGAPRAAVLRPTPDALKAAGGARSFRQCVATSSLAYLGREYASAPDLTSATWLRPMRRLLRKTGGPLLRRWFCSSLVAQAYADAGIDIVTGDVAHAAPGTFARSSLLQPVPNAVLTLGRSAGRTPTPGPVPPSKVIGGALSAAAGNVIINAAVETARSGSFAKAIRELEPKLSQLLRVPVCDFGDQLRFEASLRHAGLL